MLVRLLAPVACLLVLPATTGYAPLSAAAYYRRHPRSAFAPSLGSARGRVVASSAPSSVDELIHKMRSTSTQQLMQLVAENIGMIDASFFLRLAELCDATEDRLEKARLSELADIVSRTLQSAVEQTDKVADEKSRQAQELIAMLTDERGEFVTPVPAEKLAALRERVRTTLPQLDESFVATVRSFIKKCADDRFDGMVVVLQKVLQVFASELLLSMCAGLREEPRDAARAVFSVEPDEWSTVLRERARAGELSLSTASQALKEEVAQLVLELPSGSLTQSVVAEFLGEAIKRVDEVGDALATAE